jgi:hypothetical protein
MGVLRCCQCRVFVDEEEIIWVQQDDTHQIPYCVSCSPDDQESDYDEYR